MPSEARPQPLPSAAAPGSPGRTSSPHGGHTLLPTGSGLPHAPGPRLPGVSPFTRRDAAAARARGAPTTPGEEQRGRGRARRRPRPSPAAGPRTAPLPRHPHHPGPREMAAAPQNGSRVGGGVQTASRRRPRPRVRIFRGGPGVGGGEQRSFPRRPRASPRQEGTRGAPPALRYPRGSRVKPGGLARQGSRDGARGPLSRERVPPGRRSLTSPP